MIDELEWTCPDCGHKERTMIFCAKGSTLRCPNCLGTYTAYYEGPFIAKVTEAIRKVEVKHGSDEK